MSNEHSADAAVSDKVPAVPARSEHQADTADPDAELPAPPSEDTLYNDELAIDPEAGTLAGTDGDRGIPKP